MTFETPENWNEFVPSTYERYGRKFMFQRLREATFDE
jgi:hypothetical protein